MLTYDDLWPLSRTGNEQNDRNLHKNILPYDRNRVKLKSEGTFFRSSQFLGGTAGNKEYFDFYIMKFL